MRKFLCIMDCGRYAHPGVYCSTCAPRPGESRAATHARWNDAKSARYARMRKQNSPQTLQTLQLLQQLAQPKRRR